MAHHKLCSSTSAGEALAALGCCRGATALGRCWQIGGNCGGKQRKIGGGREGPTGKGKSTRYLVLLSKDVKLGSYLKYGLGSEGGELPVCSEG